MILFYIIVILSWSLPPFFYKKLTADLSFINIIFLKHLLFHILILSYVIYLLINRKKILKKYATETLNLSINNKLIFFGLVVLSLISGYSQLEIISKSQISYFIPIVRAFSTLLITFVGAYFFNESITKIKFLGIVFTILGIYLLNVY